MARLESVVVILFPESTKDAVNFHVGLLPRWLQLYIIRFAERRGLIGKQGD